MNLATARIALSWKREIRGEPDRSDSGCGQRSHIHAILDEYWLGFFEIKSHSSVNASIFFIEYYLV